jgi:hypothetical protein
MKFKVGERVQLKNRPDLGRSTVTRPETNRFMRGYFYARHDGYIEECPTPFQDKDWEACE